MLEAVLCTDGGLAGIGNLERLSSIHNVYTPSSRQTGSGENNKEHRQQQTEPQITPAPRMHSVLPGEEGAGAGVPNLRVKSSNA